MLDRPVSHYMRTPVFSVAAETDLETVRHRLATHNVSCLGVFDGAEPLAGVISRTDLLKAGRFERSETGAYALVLPAQEVRALMHRPAFCVDPAESVRTAASGMVEQRVHRLFVRKARNVFGVVGTLEVMRALVESRAKAHVSELMTSPVGTLDVATPLAEASLSLRAAGVTGLVVVLGPDEVPVGVFTQREALESSAHAGDAPVEGVMSARFITVNPRTALHHAAAQAAATRARHLLVMENNRLLGIVAGLDFARAAARA